MRVQAIRASETLYKAGDKSLDADYRALTKDPDANVTIQAMLTLGLFKAADLADVVRAAQTSNKARGVKEVGDRLLAPQANAGGGGRGGAALTPEQQNLLEQGGRIFNELCSSCHGDDGRGRPLAGAAAGTNMAPPLAGSPRVNGHRDYIVKALINGLTGPVGDKTYTEVMVPMGQNKDEWIAAIATYVRMNFGNNGGPVPGGDFPRGDDRAQGAMDRRRDRCQPATPARAAAHLEAFGEPQHRHGRKRADAPVVVFERSAEGRDVVPGRAADGVDRLGNPVRITGRT